jgi:hypothetical protein
MSVVPIANAVPEFKLAHCAWHRGLFDFLFRSGCEPPPQSLSPTKRIGTAVARSGRAALSGGEALFSRAKFYIGDRTRLNVVPGI